MNKLKTTFFLTSTLLSIFASMSVSAQAEQELAIGSWGGTYSDIQRATLFEPFAKKSGTKVTDVVYQGGWGQFQAAVQTGVLPFDVVQIEAAELAKGCDEGVLLKLDFSRIGKKEDFIENALHPCGVGQTTWMTVITYNTGTIGTPPTKVADFWDLEKWPGKRGLRAGPTFNLEFALLADGVAPDQVYEVLTATGGVDRAFAKLDKIKDQIIWWKAGVQPGEMVIAGDVVMSMGYNNRIGAEITAGKPEGFLCDGNVNGLDNWAVMAKTKNIDAAYAFLAYYATPEPQIAFAQSSLGQLGPSLKSVYDKLPSEAAPFVPTEACRKLGVNTGSPKGTQFWLENLDTISERWNAWAGQ